MIADGVLCRQRGKNGQRLRRKAIHDFRGLGRVVAVRKIVAHKALHIGIANRVAGAGDLVGDVGELVVGIGA